MLFVIMVFTPLKRRVEQRATIKFMQKSGSTPIEIWRKLKDVFGQLTLSKTQVRVWFNIFKEGDLNTDTADGKRSGRPRRHARFVNKVRKLLEKDRRLTLQQISDRTGLTLSSVHRIIKKDLKLSKLSAKFIPHILTDEHKARRVADCQKDLQMFNQDHDLLEKIITTDESWFPLFDPETKHSSSEWRVKGSKRPTKALRATSRRKTMCILFFDTVGVVHIEFLPQGQTVNSDFYISVLTRLKESIRRKRPVMWKGGFDGKTDRDFLLLQDNATPHVSVPTLAFFGENDFDLLSHPPYSPDLAPCDFWAFPHVKSQMRGRAFPSIDAIQKEVKSILRKTPKETFSNAIYDLPVRWSKCVQAKGEYFEGQGIPFDPEDLPLETESDSDSDSETFSDAF